MRFLCLVFSVFLLVSLVASGSEHVLKYCPKMGYCSTKCSKMEKWARSSDCKGHCCLPDNWKWK